MAKQVINEPTANVLMISMRSMGYSFEAAIADIIDNSITAKSNKIEIKFPVEPLDSYIAICDDGEGMSREELFDAMKYGSEMKGMCRDEDDLGRFGLGLKAASLSQCKKMTVISKKNSIISACSWDLDHIRDIGNWSMLEYNLEEIEKLKFIEILKRNNSGTIVLWEKFDIIEKTEGDVFSYLSSKKEDIANYLELVFHRYLNNENKKLLDIKINDYYLKGLDPFLESHKKTSIRKKIDITIKNSNGEERNLIVRPYILPFVKDMKKEDMKLVGGIEDYKTKQGFYIYRNKRLIVWGTWFGRKKGELTKNARIKVDIPNDMDDIWEVDIRKQQAKIPKTIKHQLNKAIDEAMNMAEKAQTFRGRRDKIDEGIDYLWDRIKCREEKYIYTINRDSKVFELIKNDISDSTWEKLDMVLEEIENSIPYQQIYIDKSQNKVEELDESDDRIKDIEYKAQIFISLMVGDGLSQQEAKSKLFTMEPFNKYKNLLDEL